MKKLRHSVWSLGLISMAFAQASALHAESEASEDIQPTFGFFESDAYTGRRAIVADCESTRQPLNAYGLAKKVSSWVNNSPWRIVVEDAYGNRLWIEPPYSRSPDLEPGKDNQAWSFRCIK